MATVPVLRLDPDLGAGIESSKRETAERTCLARVLEAEAGAWDAEEAVKDHRTGFGLLVLSGTLCRRVAQGRLRGAELLGPGDLLRPWDRVGEWSSIPAEADWVVIGDARLAILDADFSRQAASFPEIAVALTRRSLLRSRYLAILVAIVNQRTIETRLNLLFWHLADRFGYVRGEWIDIPVPLTHSLLSELVAARRPSVSTALSSLRDRGVLVRNEDGWALRGTAPEGFGLLHDAAD
jgi:CRP/FNR family transcriptional regulator, cyclic AMP receptor protein